MTFISEKILSVTTTISATDRIFSMEKLTFGTQKVDYVLAFNLTLFNPASFEGYVEMFNGHLGRGSQSQAILVCPCSGYSKTAEVFKGILGLPWDEATPTQLPDGHLCGTVIHNFWICSATINRISRHLPCRNFSGLFPALIPLFYESASKYVKFELSADGLATLALSFDFQAMSIIHDALASASLCPAVTALQINKHLFDVDAKDQQNIFEVISSVVGPGEDDPLSKFLQVHSNSLNLPVEVPTSLRPTITQRELYLDVDHRLSSLWEYTLTNPGGADVTLAERLPKWMVPVNIRSKANLKGRCKLTEFRVFPDVDPEYFMLNARFIGSDCTLSFPMEKRPPSFPRYQWTMTGGYDLPGAWLVRNHTAVSKSETVPWILTPYIDISKTTVSETTVFPAAFFIILALGSIGYTLLYSRVVRSLKPSSVDSY